MQVQSVNANTQFESRHKRNNVEDIETFVSLDDSQLKYFAYMNNNDPKENKKEAKKANALFWAIPIVDTIASAVLVQKRTNPIGFTEAGELLDPHSVRKLLTKSPLSDRAKAAAGAGAFWAGALALVGLYNVGKNALTKNSKHAKNFENTNPVTSFIVDLGLIFAGFMGVSHLLTKSAVKSCEENPDKFAGKLQKIYDKFAKLDDTKFAKKTMPKIQNSLEKFVENSPKLSKAGRFALANSVWILFGAGLLNSMHSSIKKSRRIENDYQQLKQTQFEAAKFLAAKRELESEILAEKAEAKVKSKPEPKKTKPIEEIEEIDSD